jgi:hypothetical protein
MSKGHTRYCRLVRGSDVKKLTVSGIPISPKYCVRFIAYPQFTNVAAGRELETHVFKEEMLFSKLVI